MADKEPQVPNTKLGIDSTYKGYYPTGELADLVKGLFKANEKRDRDWKRWKKLKYRDHNVVIPEEYKALHDEPVKVPYVMNAITGYTDGILNGGYRFKVPPRTNTEEARELSTIHERWVTAAMHTMEDEAPKGAVMRPTASDLATYGQGAQKIVPAADRWNNIPTADSEYGKKRESLSKKQRKSLDKRRKSYLANAGFPVAWRHVPIQGFYPLYTDRLTLAVERTWRTEYELMQEYDCRIQAQKGDKSGRIKGGDGVSVGPFGPAISGEAEGGAGSQEGAWIADSNNQAPSESDDWTGKRGAHNRQREVWEIADDWCWYVFVGGELVARWVHGQGFNPYDHVYARYESDGEGGNESPSVVSNLDGIIQAFDRHLTIKEIAAVKNVGQYHILAADDVTARPPMSQDNRQPATVPLVHGEMAYIEAGFRPMSVSEQVSPDNLQTILLFGELSREQGINPIAQGGEGATSGYDRNQISNAFGISRAPFATALSKIAASQGKKLLHIYEHDIAEKIELHVDKWVEAPSSTPNEAVYAVDPGKLKGWHHLLCLLEPRDMSFDIGRMQMGLQLWQGTGNKRGIAHGRVAEDFWGYENPDEIVNEVAADEFLDTPAVKSVVNKIAASEAGVDQLYEAALEDTRGQQSMEGPAPQMPDMGATSPGPGIEQPLAQPGEMGVDPSGGGPVPAPIPMAGP